MLLGEKAATVEVVGVDCPLGWPDAFVDFVTSHQNTERFVSSVNIDQRRQIAYRETDRAVRHRFGSEVRPFSVAADKLGLVAVRCAGLLGTFAGRGLEVDRTGATGAVVEVYPAASLRAWNLPARSYKGVHNRDILSHLLDRLAAETREWLDLGDNTEALAHTDDAFDALIAALTARAARTSLTAAVPAETDLHTGRYAREGWIHVPADGSLPRLRHASG